MKDQTTVMQKIGDQLRAYRESAGLTQEELSKKTEIAIGSISDWERGVRTPTIQKLLVISEALDVSIDDLLGKSPAERRLSVRLSPTEPAADVMRLVIRATQILEEASKKEPAEGQREMMKALGVLQIVTDQQHPVQ